MTEAELIELLAGLPDTDVLTVDETSGAPEIAWGDTFATYTGAKQPFATIVVKDYGDFDDVSQLDREGVFRLNVNVGRDRLPKGDFDYTAFDVVMPHPVYAAQGFACVVNPGDRTARELIELAHARAAARR
ncbi:DUF6194 family protein [Solirubrobacter taibaiensis]|nr:DUF6194 family protein [Solirubrobacter taibaiensis]